MLKLKFDAREERVCVEVEVCQEYAYTVLKVWYCREFWWCFLFLLLLWIKKSFECGWSVYYFDWKTSCYALLGFWYDSSLSLYSFFFFIYLIIFLLFKILLLVTLIFVTLPFLLIVRIKKGKRKHFCKNWG